MKTRLSLLLGPLCAGLLAVLAWYILAGTISPERRFLLPTPGAILYSFVEYGPELASATLHTLKGALLGFGAAILFSFVCAATLGLSRGLRASLFPFLLILQTTPIIVIAPILVLWIGPGTASVAIITFLVSFFPLVVNTTQGLIATDRKWVELFRLYHASKWQELRLLRLPAALPYFFTGLRIAAALAPIGAIAGDFYAGNSAGGQGGLGFLTLIYSAQFKMPALFATAATSCALGALFNLAATTLAWLVLHRWHDAYHPEQD